MLTQNELSELVHKNAGNLFSITHIADFDGICSAAMLVHYSKISKEHVMFGNYSGEELASLMAEVEKASPKNSLVVFSDLALNDSKIDTVTDLLKQLKASGNQIAWIDHHPWSEAAIAAASEHCDFIIAGENKDFCATELVFKYLYEPFGEDLEYGKRVSEIAHLGDFNLKSEKYDKLLHSLAGAIAYMNYSRDIPGLREMVAIAATGDLESEFISKKYSYYLAELEKNMQSFRESMRLYYANGIKIGVAYGKRIQSTHACGIISETLDSDISIYIDTERGKLHFRSKPGIDCSKLAATLGGGGHPQASGAEIEGVVLDETEIKRTVDRLIESAKGIYAKPSGPSA
ncbi:MAG: DHHA1 domain-containing protein [Candidatus Micrarchaeales archaeon]|jgi:Predicted phosphohydrolase (DHH superfamily)|uniref:Phosphoesterase RecJ domain protein n=1 Tax=Candidatus Micrarchaeum acidiphilum ARMAN-2 TaxID=425595 RepID=C7DIF7_MICA2|nr:MAG: phosphoesterase RecJ domain protein [Candidatus Micrarchaeum acidiphilum ARMAN-2]MCW6160985.1 DHHA1 domain-containing protein [Candidatus Micrarchaeales archaeon]